MVRLTVADLTRMCKERLEESPSLEFKACNELKVGSDYWHRDEIKKRIPESIREELSRDVSAMLNAAGGVIVYGILELKKDKRAKSLDASNIFRPEAEHNVTPEKVTDWLRTSIQPPPSVSVYRVFEGEPEDASAWYLVVEAPQGQLAYMAMDKRFYKRVGNVVKPMEQYEVVDVMNRARGAALNVRLTLQSQTPRDYHWTTLNVKVQVTSTNFVASEQGALKLTVALPMKITGNVGAVSKGGLIVEGYEEVPHANELMLRWGPQIGIVVFPDDWYDFGNLSMNLLVPSQHDIPNPTYLMQATLFTLNAVPRKSYYVVTSSGDDFEMQELTSDFGTVFEAFWSTYHKGIGFLRQLRVGGD